MTKGSPTTDSCLSDFTPPSRFRQLGALASSFDATRALAKFSAASLVVASAGLGAYYAWTVGNEHGAVLGSLFVLFAVGLEVAKPLSVVAAFKAFGAWQLVRGVALSVLAAVAIAYSLSAELTLMAGTRGDVVAQRQASLDASAETAADRKRLVDRQTDAQTELRDLAPSRPAAEVQAEIDALLMTPGADSCSVINGRVSREVCPKVAALRIEKARADRRVELEAILAAPLPATQPSTSARGKAVNDADPGASALATYLGALGFVVPVKVLSDWLALVPVIALELGSALSGVLVLAISAAARNTTPKELGKGVPGSIETGVPALKAQFPALVSQAQQTSVPVFPRKRDDHDSDDTGGPTNGARLATALLGHLRENRGKVQGGQRGLAKLLGASTTEFNRTLRKLADAGVVLVTPDRLAGTTIELAAA